MRLRYFVLIVALLFSLVRPAAGQDGFGSGKWGTGKVNGVHWLLDPSGKPFYSKGVNIVSPGMQNEKSMAGHAYCWSNFYPSMEHWRAGVGGQLKEWGFNTLGGWSECSAELGLALTVDLELGRNSRFHWFDPFDPKMEQVVLERARELTAPFRGLPFLIGYYSDNEVGWWNSSLFTWYLKAGWENHTKRHLWEMLNKHYGGSWEKLLADWVPQGGLGSFDALRNSGAALKLRPGGDGIRLVDRFMSECARLYYELMYKGIRTAHPEALVLGDRLPLYYHQDAVLAIGNNVDVISTNYNVDVPDGWVAPYYFDGLRKLSGKPVLVTEFFFAAEENRSGNRNETARNVHAKPGHLMTVDTQIQRAWGAGNALLNFARFPNVVGAHWFQYSDEPFGGREDGEDYNMGLVDTSNRPYEELTASFSKLNPVLETVHRESATRLSRDRSHEASAADSVPVQATLRGDAGAVRAPRPAANDLGRPSPPVKSDLARTKSDPAQVSRPDAGDLVSPRPARVRRIQRPIDVADQSLMEWEKESTLLSGFSAPAPYVPFGDVHLAWAPEGFYLFSLSNTYVDPDFLEHGGDFPLSEAFQLHFTVQVEGKRHHFAAFLVPGKNPAFPDGFEIKPELFRMKEGSAAERLPGAGRVQRLEKSLPHMAIEAFYPAGWFGLNRLEPGMRLGVNIGLISYFREFSMAFAGKPDVSAITNPSELRIIELE